MSRKHGHYDSREVWDQDLQAGQRNLAQAILDHWPDGVRTALDLGCGDGKITHALAAQLDTRFLGLDGSREALSRFHLPAVQADLAKLPIAGQSVDLAVSTDVFEHLDTTTENRAWKELFRIASKWVMVAVPFREVLAEGTARCTNCGTHYHVNWHQRPYDIRDLIARQPEGWSIAGIVLTGERWSSMLPAEIHFRREVLDQFAGWRNAVCPSCGAPGEDPAPLAPLASLPARLLGTVVYQQLAQGRFLRSHSEILIAFSRSGGRLKCRGRRALAVPRVAGQARLDLPPAAILDPFPQVAKAVAAVDGGLVVQLPVYPGCAQTLRFTTVREGDFAVAVVVEDGLGVVYAGELNVPAPREALLDLPRALQAGYYGALVRLPADHGLAGVALPGGPAIEVLCPDGDPPNYFPATVGSVAVSIQVTEPLAFDLPALEHSGQSSDEIWRLLVRLLVQEHDALRERREELSAQCEVMRASRDELSAQCEAMRASRDELSAECNKMQAELDRLTHKHAALAEEQSAMRARFEVRLGARLRTLLTRNQGSDVHRTPPENEE